MRQAPPWAEGLRPPGRRNTRCTLGPRASFGALAQPCDTREQPQQQGTRQVLASVPERNLGGPHGWRGWGGGGWSVCADPTRTALRTHVADNHPHVLAGESGAWPASNRALVIPTAPAATRRHRPGPDAESHRFKVTHPKGRLWATE